MGVDKPNYTQIPNTLLDDLMMLMDGAELKVTLAIARQTFGYHRERHSLSLSELQGLTGLSRQGVINGVDAGEKRGTIARGKGRRGGFVYELIIDTTSQINGLVKKVDTSTSQKSRLVETELVQKVDQTSQENGLELVNKVDLATPMLNKEKETIKENTEKEEGRAGDPLSVAWRQVYADVPMPPKLAKSLQELAGECGMAAAIHGIKASAANPEGRNFKYIAECARNYVPPPPMATYALGNPYSADIPGIVPMPAAPLPAPIPEPPPPMAHDDPWAIALAELAPVLPGRSGQWLIGSRLAENGELAGVPLYCIHLVTDSANIGWLKQQAEPAIRKKLSSILGKRILLDFAIVERVAA